MDIFVILIFEGHVLNLQWHYTELGLAFELKGLLKYVY